MTDDINESARKHAKEERARHPAHPGTPEDQVAVDVELVDDGQTETPEVEE